MLKNSLAESARKNRRARMTYKRFSPDANTFLVIRFKPVFGKTEFFNSYSPYHSQSCQTGVTCGMATYRQLHFSGIGKSPAFVDLPVSAHREGPSDERRDAGRPSTNTSPRFGKAPTPTSSF